MVLVETDSGNYQYGRPRTRVQDCIIVIARSMEDVRKVMKGYHEEDVYARAILPALPTLQQPIRFAIPSCGKLSMLSPPYIEPFFLRLLIR